MVKKHAYVQYTSGQMLKNYKKMVCFLMGKMNWVYKLSNVYIIEYLVDGDSFSTMENRLEHIDLTGAYRFDGKIISL